MVLLIPAPTHEAHFAANIAIDAIWNLEEHVRYLLRLHREGQSSWAKIHRDLQQSLQEHPIAGARGMEQKRELYDLEQRISNLQGQLTSLKNRIAQDVPTTKTARRRPTSTSVHKNAQRVA